MPLNTRTCLVLRAVVSSSAVVVSPTMSGKHRCLVLHHRPTTTTPRSFVRAMANSYFCPEEIRRSHRATKGQYTKERDIIEDAAPPKKGRGKGAKAKVQEAEDEEDDAKIRCICGEYDEEEEESRTMICCDNCEAWQHNDCMLLPDGFSPEKYFCEQCKPEDHKDLLAAIERGEKPWEEVAARRKAAEAEKLAKKKGKKGKKGTATRVSDAPSRGSQSVEPAQTPASTKNNGQKRKHEEPAAAMSNYKVSHSILNSQNNLTMIKDSKKARQDTSETPVPKNGARTVSANRKSGAMATPSRQASRSGAVSNVVSSADQLEDETRKNAAKHVVKLFIDQTNLAVKQGTFSVPQGHTAKDIGNELALRVENAMYNVLSNGSGEPSEAYKNQLRTISFNVKKNPALRDRLLNGSLSAHGLAAMDAKDMASEEQQQADAAAKKEMEKQYTITAEQGPRIRRTHKGDEYVHEADQIAAESTGHVRSTSTRMDDQMKSPDTVMSPGFQEPGGRELPVNTKGRPRLSMDSQRKGSSNFDINNVWENVHGSPDGDRQHFPQISAHPVEPHSPPPLGGTQADAEIDQMLKDEDVESEAPYSPKDVAEEEILKGDAIVWKGIVNGGAMGRFHAEAKFAAGAKLADLSMGWRELIPKEISVEGRIHPDRANEYLCGLQYSSSSDIVVVSIIEPPNPVDAENFDRFFTYFKGRGRIAVGVPHNNPAIKDIYLMPLSEGEELPALLNLLEEHNIEAPIKERLLLVPFVIKNTELPGATPRDSAPIMASPMTSVPPGSSLPPMPQPQDVPAGAMPYGSPQPTLQPYQGVPAGGPPLGPPSALAAWQVMGPMANSRAVQDLIKQVPQAGVTEMNVVKEIILQNPMAGQDLAVLTQMLQSRHQPDAGQ